MKTLPPASYAPALEALNGLVAPGLYEPHALRIEANPAGENLVIFQITVAPADMPRLIGKGGNSISALKILMSRVGRVHGHSVRVVVLEPRPAPPTKAKTLWTLDACKAGLTGYLNAIGHEGTVAIVDARNDTQLVVIDPEPEEEIDAALSKWVQNMGSPAGVRFILDENDA